MRRCMHGMIACAIATALSAPLSAQVVNGSFESCPGYANLGPGSSAVPGWTTTREGVEWFAQSAGYAAYSGTCMVDLAVYTSNGTPGGGIAQALSLTAGTAYSLSFAGSTSTGSGRDGTGIIELWMNGVFANSYSVANPSSTITSADWRVFTYDFTATSSTTVEFRNREDALLHFAIIDGVSVTPAVVATPEPASLMLFATGLVTVCVRRQRRRRA